MEQTDPPAKVASNDQLGPTLKPCPFCGSDAALWRGGAEQWRVHCHGCEVLKGPYDTPEKAAYRWNKRTHELVPADPLCIEELFDEAADADEETHVRFARLLEQHHGIGAKA